MTTTCPPRRAAAISDRDALPETEMKDLLDLDQLLTDHGRDLVENPQGATADLFRDEYRRMGVVQIDDVLDRDRLIELTDRFRRELNPFLAIMTKQHRILGEGSAQALGTGFRFGRADPALVRQKARREAMVEKFEELGLETFGDQLSEALTPFVHHVIEQTWPSRRVYCFIYREGDYISAHNDSQTGDRVNVQFPVPLATSTCFRAMDEDGRFRLYYDHPGCMRILGPRVWHEVPPILRWSPDQEPWRVLLSLRYMQREHGG